MLDEFAFSCGTPSMNVVTAGLFGLEPMPRKRALLSLRAVNSLKNVFGAYCAASLTLRTPASSIVSSRDGRDADRRVLHVLGLLLAP